MHRKTLSKNSYYQYNRTHKSSQYPQIQNVDAENLYPALTDSLTTVLGEGRSPDMGHLMKLGLDAKIPQESIDRTIAQTKSVLSEWVGLAKQYSVSAGNVKRINSHFSPL